MDISDIAMLEAIVKYGSISKASEALNVTQPTLSRRLSRLESKLSTSLFLRNSSGLTPTEHTNFIIDSSASIKTEIKAIERHIELMNTLESGDLRIGVGPIVEQLYFPHALLQLTKSPSSDLNITIRTEKSDDLKKLLLDGSVDIAIGPFEESENDDCLIYPIVNQPLIIASRVDHPITLCDSPLTMDQVFNYPLIAPHIPQYMIEQLASLGSLNKSRRICDNYSIVKEVVKRSDHITIGPSAIFSEEIHEGEITITPMPVPVNWYAACLALPQNACLPVIQKVIDIFQRYDLPKVNLDQDHA